MYLLDFEGWIAEHTFMQKWIVSTLTSRFIEYNRTREVQTGDGKVKVKVGTLKGKKRKMDTLPPGEDFESFKRHNKSVIVM